MSAPYLTPDQDTGPQSRATLEAFQTIFAFGKNATKQARNFLGNAALVAIVFPSVGVVVLQALIDKVSTPTAADKAAPQIAPPPQNQTPPCNDSLKGVKPVVEISKPAGKWRGTPKRVTVRVIASTAPPVTSAKVEKLDPAKQLQLLTEKEVQNWRDFINYHDLDYHPRAFGKDLIEGAVTSSATAAVYQSIKLQVTFFSQTGDSLGYQNVVLFDLLLPGKSFRVREKVKTPTNTKKAKYRIIEVTPAA